MIPLTPLQIYVLITCAPTMYSFWWLLHWANEEEDGDDWLTKEGEDRWRTVPGSYAITRDILSNEDKDLN